MARIELKEGKLIASFAASMEKPGFWPRKDDLNRMPGVSNQGRFEAVFDIQYKYLKDRSVCL